MSLPLFELVSLPLSNFGLRRATRKRRTRRKKTPSSFPELNLAPVAFRIAARKLWHGEVYNMRNIRIEMLLPNGVRIDAASLNDLAAAVSYYDELCDRARTNAHHLRGILQ